MKGKLLYEGRPDKGRKREGDGKERMKDRERKGTKISKHVLVAASEAVSHVSGTELQWHLVDRCGLIRETAAQHVALKQPACKHIQKKIEGGGTTEQSCVLELLLWVELREDERREEKQKRSSVGTISGSLLPPCSSVATMKLSSRLQPLLSAVTHYCSD